MDYIPFATPGAAFEYALRHGYALYRRQGLDTPIIIGVTAVNPDGNQRFQLHRIETHYEWKEL